jgi:hypothetical protein
MKRSMIAVLSLVVLVIIAVPVQAETTDIDFDSLSPSGGTTPFSLYQEDGYSLTNNVDIIFGDPSWPPTPMAFGWWATSYSGGYAGSLALFNNYQALTTTLTKDDSTPFSMVSIDLSRLGGGSSSAGGSVIFSGIKSDNSTVTQTFTYSDALAFQTKLFSSDFGNLKSLSWITADPWVQEIQFDNITMVPEPSTLVLLGIGTLGLLAYGWRRR